MVVTRSAEEILVNECDGLNPVLQFAAQFEGEVDHRRTGLNPKPMSSLVDGRQHKQR